jgi:hypothetical protein
LDDKNLENISEPIARQMADISSKLQNRVVEEFSPIVGTKDELRGKLLHEGLIHRVDISSYPQVASMAAVDGARIQEKLYAGDFLVSLATLANALRTPEKFNSEDIVWADIMQHSDGTDRVSQTAMGSGEVYLLSRAKHEIRIMDGSLVTPLIMLREGLFVKSHKIQLASAEILEEKRSAESLSYLIDRAHDGLISIAKSDSATYFARDFDEKFGLRFPISDRFLATQILQPGEMFQPRVLRELEKQTVDAPNSSDKKVLKAANDLKVEYERIGAMARKGLIYTTYYRPVISGNPNAVSGKNVIRLEFSIQEAEANNVVEIAKRYAGIVNSDMMGPHMLEPYCQHLVDRQAKTISDTAKMFKNQMIAQLPKEQAEAYRELLMRGYRT